MVEALIVRGFRKRALFGERGRRDLEEKMRDGDEKGCNFAEKAMAIVKEVKTGGIGSGFCAV